jgi:hypothetical protein
MRKLATIALMLFVVGAAFAADVTSPTAPVSSRPDGTSKPEVKATAPVPADQAGGPDGYGYYYKDERETGGPTYSWIDESGGTPLALTGDDAYVNVPLPFGFTYYGTTYNSINVCTNGFISFNASSTSYSNVALPTATIPAATICPYWDDLYVDPSTGYNDSVYAKSVSGKFVIIYHKVEDLSSWQQHTFEVILDPADMSITFQYQVMPTTGASATVGQQGAQSGLNFLQFSYNTGGAVVPGRAIKFWKQAAADDVGVSSITAPTALFTPGTPITPTVVVRNFGTNSESNIPVTFWVDSGATRVYNQSATVTGPLAPGATANVTFSPNWTPGNALNYSVKSFTSLSADTSRSNDTSRLTTANANFVWTPFTPNPVNTDRIVHALVYDPVGDKFYMIGGNPAGATGTYVASCDRYDPATNAWAAMAPKPTATGWSPGSYCRGKIYYITGHTNASTVQANTEIYDIATNAWTTGTSPRPLSATCPIGQVTWRDTLIYVLGGTNLTVGYTNVDIYNPFTNTWAVGTPLPQVGDMGGAAIIGDTIYITNAINRGASTCWPNLVKGYINPVSPTTITWITGPAHGANATSITGTAALGGKVYWFGGFLGLATPTANGWVYDPATGLISAFPMPYRGTIGRCQWLGARTLPGPNSGLYGFAGDSSLNWSAPNRGYYRFPIPTGAAPTHNVGCTRIIEPTGSYSSGTVVTPACSTYNYGNQTEGYAVRMKIGVGYNQTASVTGHAPGAMVYVTFPSWTANPVGGPYLVSCSTELTGDAVPANDKATGQVTVTAPLPADIAVRTITIPDTLVYCNWDTVRVNVFNLGGLPAAPPWWLVFEDLNLSTQQLHKDSVLVTDTINAGAGRDYIFVWHPDPCNHLLTLTARYSDQNMNNNVLTKTVVVKSLDVEVNGLSIDPQGRPFQVCTWHWIDVSVHNKSVHLWDPTLYNVPIVVRVTRPGGSEALLDTIIAPRLPYCSTLVFYSDSFHLDSAGIWRIHAEVIVSGDNVPGNNYKDSTIVVTQGAVVTPGWARLTDILQGPKGKGVKDGGCVAYKPDSTGEYVYALKGNGRCEFYQYNIETNAWEAKESIPAIGSSGKKKPVKKGGTMTQAAGRMYAAKGNSTVEWWQYDPALSGTQTYPWTQKLDVPAGVKPVLKEGTGAAAVTIGDTAYVYLLRGAGGTEFLRYNTLSNTWTAMAPAPTGTSGKGYKDGSCLATDGSTTVWALKGSYNELYAYDVGTNVWVTKRPLPMTGSSGKKKKVKSGGGMARLNGSVLAQKGNNTREFWSYAADSDDWYQLEDVPLGGGKNVKPGGSICAGSTSTYSLKGNGTFEFFSYTPATFGLVQALSPKSEVQSGSPRIAHSALSVSPNPFSGTTTISYTLPTAGTASLRLYDVTGQLVATLATGSHTAGVHTLTTPTLARGIYVLKLTTDATTTTRKLIVE